MKCEGIVESFEQEDAVISIDSLDCEKCGLCSCAGPRSIRLPAACIPNGVKTGDKVYVHAETKSVARHVLAAYAIPTGLVIVCAGLSRYIGVAFSCAAMAASLSLYFMLLYRFICGSEKVVLLSSRSD